MIKRKFDRLLRKLRREGYLKSDNPMSQRILAAVKALALRPDVPEWVEVFLESVPVARWELPLYEHAQVADVSAIFKLLGRFDDERDSSEKVLIQWLRMGLGAKVVDVAAASDVSHQYASRVRISWEDELRCLLADCACIGITGEDIADAVTTVGYFPDHIYDRLIAFRQARDNAPAGSTSKEQEEELQKAWFAYRVQAGRHGLSPDDHECYFVPKWFRKAYL